MDTKQIYASLCEINKEIEAIGKTNKNQQQGFNFRGIDDVMNELHGLFSKNNVLIIPTVKEIKRDERTNSKGTLIISTLLTVEFTFIASDGSSLTAVAIGEAMDMGDKGVNKAMSIALKYVLLQMFLIPTIEQKDPDSESHELKPKQPQQTKNELKPNTPQWNEAIKYLKGGGKITDIEKKYILSIENKETLLTEAI